MIERISRDWDLKPGTWDRYNFYLLYTGAGRIPLSPNAFKIQAASYLYLKEIARKKGKRFVYQKELDELIKDAEKDVKSGIVKTNMKEHENF